MKKTKKTANHRKVKRRQPTARRMAAPASKRSQQRDDAKVMDLISYSITYDPIDDEYSHLVPAKIEKEISELYLLSVEKPKEAIPRLEELRGLYPEHPRICNYLAGAYSHVGDSNKMIEIVEENYRRNPGYLFAKMNYAEICLQRGETEKIPEIVEHKFDLKLLYPERNAFHVTEAVSFFGLLGLYFMEINELKRAESMLTMLEDLDEDAHMTRRLRKRISRAKRFRRLKDLLGGGR
ncbi:MAG: DUF4919 domain-containing protein [Deltaproteobacteria bacterium]|nr:DUF4919 domain-containing protein [Deltaproteobacteria bacterium]